MRRYIDIINEATRRNEAEIVRVLRDIIARPSTNPGERENAKRQLDAILSRNPDAGKETAVDVGDESPAASTGHRAGIWPIEVWHIPADGKWYRKDLHQLGEYFYKNFTYRDLMKRFVENDYRPTRIIVDSSAPDRLTVFARFDEGGDPGPEALNVALGDIALDRAVRASDENTSGIHILRSK